MLSIESILEDPARGIVRGHFHGEMTICSTCKCSLSEESDMCPDCYGVGFSVALGEDVKKQLKNSCDSRRRWKENEIPDEEIQGTTYMRYVPIEYSLKSVFCTIHKGKREDRVKDYNEWERGVSLLPIISLDDGYHSSHVGRYYPGEHLPRRDILFS